MLTERVERQVNETPVQEMPMRLSAALMSLEALLDPEDHLPHPVAECTGECQAVRAALEIRE